jgi:hypothetical protein
VVLQLGVRLGTELFKGLAFHLAMGGMLVTAVPPVNLLA